MKPLRVGTAAVLALLGLVGCAGTAPSLDEAMTTCEVAIEPLIETKGWSTTADDFCQTALDSAESEQAFIDFWNDDEAIRQFLVDALR